MTKFIKIAYRVLGLRVPTKYLPGRVITFTDAEVVRLRSAYDQPTDGQW